MNTNKLPDHVTDACPRCESRSAEFVSEIHGKSYSIVRCLDCQLQYAREFEQPEGS